MKEIIAITTAILLVAAFYFWPKNVSERATEAIPARSLAESATSRAAQALAPEDSQGKALAMNETPLETNEKAAIGQMMQLLADSEAIGQSPRSLFDALGKSGLKPVAAKDSNAYTGTLWTVRTDNTLPGTRYFHAQLFGEESTHLQHASFEIRPGSDSMETALALVQQANPGLGRPEIERDGFVLWRKSKNRVVWVKRLSAAELRESRFNAHSPEDAGTIWVASEDEPSHEIAER